MASATNLSISAGSVVGSNRKIGLPVEFKTKIVILIKTRAQFIRQFSYQDLIRTHFYGTQLIREKLGTQLIRDLFCKVILGPNSYVAVDNFKRLE